MGEYYVMAINAISVREDTLSGQLPSDKELASEGPEARQGSVAASQGQAGSS